MVREACPWVGCVWGWPFTTLEHVEVEAVHNAVGFVVLMSIASHCIVGSNVSEPTHRHTHMVRVMSVHPMA